MKLFIATNIHAHVPDPGGCSLLLSSKYNAASFSHPVDPHQTAYNKLASAVEFCTVCAIQMHECTCACLRLSKGHWVCKCCAPFPLADDNLVNEHGDWGPKCQYGFLNNFCPSLVQTLHSNHNIKLIMNGISTKNLVWYISKYAMKLQELSMNMSALLAKMYAFKPDQKACLADLSWLNKNLLQRCANTLSHKQELSAPQVVSYLMGWGDCFISHHFETIHWYAVVSLLKRCYPILTESMSVPFLGTLTPVCFLT